ncbi:MAG TPA: serine/threonine-protein kinase, partial [Candidatus Acidoferrales bacterium]|nr:serine/threonine-protein kinase [Candidatus Acidoferrales bacterium]
MASDSSPSGAFAGTERFKPISLLGQGAMGIVYRARDLEMGIDVALKTLARQAPDDLYRLKQEFRVLAGIRHPNLVELYELEIAAGHCFLTMEVVEGRNFFDYVRDSSAPPIWNTQTQARFVGALEQLLNGLNALHAADRLHRDVKPSNILVDDAGRVVILDFGLATALGFDGQRELSGMVGTFAYMAPEQAWGNPLTSAADWYSVGIVLYETLTGRVPFTGAPTKVMRAKESSLPSPPSTYDASIPKLVDDLVVSLLNPDPQKRAGSKEVAEQLQRLSSSFSTLRPQREAPRLDIPFVGRNVELAKLEEACSSVHAGTAAIVHVYGPSGIGKTELIRRFLASVEESEQAVLLCGRCHPRESIPYKSVDTIVDALSRFLISIPIDQAVALTPRHVGSLARLFPVVARVPGLAQEAANEPDAEPYEMRRRGFAALRELLSRIGDRWRLILWIDDLQWGDMDSAALLRELLRPPDPPTMALILSYRSEDRGYIPS